MACSMAFGSRKKRSGIRSCREYPEPVGALVAYLVLMPFVSSILPNCVERDRNLSYPHRQRPELCPWVRTLQSPSDAGTAKVNDSRAPDAGAEPARSSPEQLADKVFGNRSRHGTILLHSVASPKNAFLQNNSSFPTIIRHCCESSFLEQLDIRPVDGCQSIMFPLQHSVRAYADPYP